MLMFVSEKMFVNERESAARRDVTCVIDRVFIEDLIVPNIFCAKSLREKMLVNCLVNADNLMLIFVSENVFASERVPLNNFCRLSVILNASVKIVVNVCTALVIARLLSEKELVKIRVSVDNRTARLVNEGMFISDLVNAESLDVIVFVENV